MKKLTLEHAIENKFNAEDCVRYFDENLSKEEVDYILWEETCFPFSTETMIEQLNKKFIK